jgi:predicted nucleic acid-binding protein
MPSIGRDPARHIDCLVAAVALRHDARLLTADSDLTHVANAMGIAIEPV